MTSKSLEEARLHWAQRAVRAAFTVSSVALLGLAAGSLAAPGFAEVLPPGHPPVRALPRLPAGHPRLPSSSPPMPLFPQQRTVTI